MSNMSRLTKIALSISLLGATAVQAQVLPTVNLLGGGTTGINYPSAHVWQDFSFTFSPTTTGANYVGLAFRQDPAYWTLGNLYLVSGSVAATGTNLLSNANFATGGSFSVTTNNGPSTIQAPRYWGIWYQNGTYPSAAGTWSAPGSGGASYSGGQGVNTSSAGAWYDGAVGTYDGIYQGVALTAGQSYTFSFSVYGDNASSNTSGGTVGLGAYSGACANVAIAASLCSIPASAGFTTLATPAQGSNAGAPATPDIVSSNNGTAGYNVVSAIGTGNFNNRFDGGTITVDGSHSTQAAAVTVNANFSITTNNGTIDQNGNYAIFAGQITNDTSGGRLIIKNSASGGGISLTNTGNSYSGGTEIQAGANLFISSPSVLGSGGLDLIGSSTVPAILSTIASMTIVNPISVTGDPIFNVAPNTTTTISSAISGSGDVEVAGGGTLNLTAVNTYSGPTIIGNGSTLALNGTGSIASSSAVTNSGTFDLSAAGNTVALGVASSYSQTSTGNLKLVAAPGNFQKMTLGSAAILDGTLTLTASLGTYSMGRYTLISAGSVSGQFSNFSNNLASVTPLGFMLGYSPNEVFLSLAPNAGATLASIQQNAHGLSTLINTQSAVLQTGLSYDCTVFDKNNICVSAGGRYSYSGAGSTANQGGLLIVGYRPTANTRIGMFVDQSLDITAPSNIAQSKTDPIVGLFGNWQMNKDGLGLNIQASAVYSTSDLEISRTSSSFTEGGQGKTQFDAYAYQLQANYVEPVSNNVTIIPYLGLRYSRIHTGAYSETSTSQVVWPVSYNAVTQSALSAIAGIGVSTLLAENLHATASVGVQQNLSYSMDCYSGTSNTPGLTSFSVQMPNKTDTLATASAGLSYNLTSKERLALNALWQQQPLSTTGTASVIATFSMGF
jgi:autotransporter-associated beta strand protein